MPDVGSVGDTDGQGPEALTIREMELIDLLRQGLSVSEIARKWKLPVSTVYQFQWRVRHKIGLADTEDICKVCADRIEQHRHVLHRNAKPRRPKRREDRWRPTERQLQIVRNRVSGMSAGESAQTLGIKRGTVNSTMDQMKERAGVKTFDELVARFVEWGLLEGSPDPGGEPEYPIPSVTLGPVQHRAWTLHLAGRSNREIAEATGAETTAVNQCLATVRKKLRKWLDDLQATSAALKPEPMDDGPDPAPNATPDEPLLRRVPFVLGPGPGRYA